MLTLRELGTGDPREEYACLKDIPPENGFENGVFDMDYDTFVKSYIPHRQDMSKGVGLKPWLVPETYYLLWDGPRAVGLFKLRHHLNDRLREGAGHIGYGIRRDCRGRGYATKGLALLLEKAWDIIPEEEAYLSVNKANPASLRVMLKNGAYIHHESEDHDYTRIKRREQKV